MLEVMMLKTSPTVYIKSPVHAASQHRYMSMSELPITLLSVHNLHNKVYLPRAVFIARRPPV